VTGAPRAPQERRPLLRCGPVASLDALRWRLRGPIGPIALAKRLAAEDPDGAAFMIAEFATTLRGVMNRQAATAGIQGRLAVGIDFPADSDEK
jgi:hypothetical protein